MLIGEPPRTPYDLNFPLFGIPIRVHPLFWLISLLMGAQGRSDAGDILTWIAAVFLSILVHELGHAMTMRIHGFRPWITLYAMGGLASYDPRDGFRTKSVDTLGEILISAAGPVAGFLLAAVLVLGVFAAGHGNQVSFVGPGHLRPWVELPNARLEALLNDILFISVFWGLINLLPIYPLDGGHISREIFLRLSPGDGIRQSMVLSMLTAGAVSAYGLLQWKDMFVAIFFGYLAYASYIALQAYSGRGRWQ